MPIPAALSNGDPHVQINDYTWTHYCRVLCHSIINIYMDYCDHCGDPSPNKQSEIHKQQLAMLRGEWCNEHNREHYHYIDGVIECPVCLAEDVLDNPYPASPYEGMF